jgi:O-methyltransferase involved in polyketide biosynthesis
VFITAEGLLMYLDPADALGLIRDCVARFPGGRMMFDSIPGRGWWRLAGWRPPDRIGPFRRMRPSITLLEFG